MKPRVEIEYNAVAKEDDLAAALYPRYPRRCQITINGHAFASRLPNSESEAIEINAAAERLVEEMRKVP